MRPRASYQPGDVIELLSGRYAVLITHRDERGWYGASLDLNQDWPDGVYGAMIRVKHEHIKRKVGERGWAARFQGERT